MRFEDIFPVTSLPVNQPMLELVYAMILTSLAQRLYLIKTPRRVVLISIFKDFVCRNSLRDAEIFDEHKEKPQKACCSAVFACEEVQLLIQNIGVGIILTRWVSL